MRTLATIQEITELHDIPDADVIVCAKVLGWHVVVKKGEFQVGDKCVYIEIDSVLPEDNPHFAFLHEHGKKGRVRTARLRGQVSQGICFPLTILPGWGNDTRSHDDIEIGYDVTELLGITKFEPPIPACIAGDVKGVFPSCVPKTDETRVQVLQDVLDRHADEDFVYTEKLDGTSCTMLVRDGEFGVCMRNYELKDTENNTLWQMARKYDVESKLRAVGKNIALQGEVIGDGIQSNKYKLPKNERRYYVFNIFDIDSYRFLDTKEVVEFCKDNDLLMVPVLGFMPLSNDIDLLVDMAKGFSALNPQTRREGIVLRPVNEKQDPDLGRLSIKAINPDFLLKYNDD